MLGSSSTLTTMPIYALNGAISFHFNVDLLHQQWSIIIFIRLDAYTIISFHFVLFYFNIFMLVTVLVNRLLNSMLAQCCLSSHTSYNWWLVSFEPREFQVTSDTYNRASICLYICGPIRYACLCVEHTYTKRQGRWYQLLGVCKVSFKYMVVQYWVELENYVYSQQAIDSKR